MLDLPPRSDRPGALGRGRPAQRRGDPLPGSRAPAPLQEQGRQAEGRSRCPRGDSRAHRGSAKQVTRSPPRRSSLASPLSSERRAAGLLGRIRLPLVRRRSGRSSALVLHASTTSVSYAVPEPLSISSIAASRPRAGRYGRPDAIDSTTSATAMIRLPMRICSPCTPSGYPDPSQRSWCWYTIFATCSGKWTRSSRSNPAWLCCRTNAISASLSRPGRVRSSDWNRQLADVMDLRRQLDRLDLARPRDRARRPRLRQCAPPAPGDRRCRGRASRQMPRER